MEKYGQIPKRFTKKWWEYFWEYYKWYVIVTALAVIITVVTIVQCAHRTRYDLVIVYAGHSDLSDEKTDKLRSLAGEYTDDIDGNGQVVVDCKTLVFTDIDGNEEYDIAIQTKLDLTFVDDYTYIYLMDEREALVYMNRKDTTTAFEDTELYAADSDFEVLHTSDSNAGYAVSLKDSALLKEKGIDGSGLYLLVRSDNKQNDRNAKSHDSALEFARALVK